MIIPLGCYLLLLFVPWYKKKFLILKVTDAIQNNEYPKNGPKPLLGYEWFKALQKAHCKFLSTNKNRGETENTKGKYAIHKRWNTDISWAFSLVWAANLPKWTLTVLVKRIFLAELNLDKSSIPYIAHKIWLGKHWGRTEALPAGAGGMVSLEPM